MQPGVLLGDVGGGRRPVPAGTHVRLEGPEQRVMGALGLRHRASARPTAFSLSTYFSMPLISGPVLLTFSVEHHFLFIFFWPRVSSPIRGRTACFKMARPPP